MIEQDDSGAKNTSKDPGGCHYVDGLMAIRPEERSNAIETLRRAGFEVEDVTEEVVFDVIGDFAGELPLGVLRMAADPHRGASYLAQLDRPITGAPIHGVGYEGHGGFMSGDGPGDPVDELTGPDGCRIHGMIAVVDSGIVEENLRPDWMGPDYVDAEAIDIEIMNGQKASHGTFVSSVIRKLAPGHGVAFAAARPDTEGSLKSRHERPPDDPPTHELEVLGAVARLVRRFGDRPSEIAALNLSLGARRCGTNDGFLLTLRIAVDMWRRSFGYDAPILAAGGNSPSLEPVYPAAFPCVRAVAAAENDGDQVVWRDSVSETPLPPRSWITDIAPGVKIHGLSGASNQETVWWSGSSFATAIATSQSVTGQSFEVDGGRTFWRARSMDYGLIPELDHG